MNEKELLGGYPALKIKRILNLSTNNFIRLSDVEEILSVSSNKAGKLMKELEALGYVAAIKRDDLWTNTVKGDLWLFEAVSRPIEREKATVLINDLVARIAVVNSDAEYLYAVEWAFVFGEYLDDEKALIDEVNICVRLKRKIADYNEHNKRVYELTNKSKKALPNVGDVEAYAIFHPLIYLKNKKHRLYVDYFTGDSYHIDTPLVLIFPV
jgi:hypothetical protein